MNIKVQGERIMLKSGSTLAAFFKWLAAACVIGGTMGLIGSAFSYSLKMATQFRTEHLWVVLFLPLGGVLIIFLYHTFHIYKPKGTNRVITAIHSDEELPARMAPLIFISTVITHLFGGSAGREGAALQLGGSIGNLFGRFLHISEKDRHVFVMCGMSAGFAALFGTPIASVIFAMEVISVGVMYYVALVPCAVSAIVACSIARVFKIFPEKYVIGNCGPVTVITASKVLFLAALCGLLSIIFCFVMHWTGNLYRKYFENQYIRIIVGSVCVILLAFVFQTADYLGSGMDIIRDSLYGHAKPEAFILKLVFTAVTLNAGFRGGEIVPSFFVGATFGCVAGGLLGLDPGFSAAICMMSMFCGVTNCPITALMLSYELFGFRNSRYFLLAVAVSYMLSGYSGLYSTQKIMYSKVTPKYVNRKTK